MESTAPTIVVTQEPEDRTMVEEDETPVGRPIVIYDDPEDQVDSGNKEAETSVQVELTNESEIVHPATTLRISFGPRQSEDPESGQSDSEDDKSEAGIEVELTNEAEIEDSDVTSTSVVAFVPKVAETQPVSEELQEDPQDPEEPQSRTMAAYEEEDEEATLQALSDEEREVEAKSLSEVEEETGARSLSEVDEDSDSKSMSDVEEESEEEAQPEPRALPEPAVAIPPQASIRKSKKAPKAGSIVVSSWQKASHMVTNESDAEPSQSVRDSILLWQSKEKSKTNEDVLMDFAQCGDAEEQAQAATLLAWNKKKKSKKPTNTMVVRQTNMMRKIVDFGDRSIVIDEKKSASGRFAVSTPPAQPQFQVRKSSVIQPESEVIVTSSWIENAIKAYEHEQAIKLIEMNFEKKPAKGIYEAFIKAKVAGSAKSYHWIIKEAPKTGLNPGGYDKDAFMVTNLGHKISDFVKAKKLKKALSIPFRPVIMADSRYAILDNLKSYRQIEDESGLDLEHVKCALRGLAKLHALSYVYFNQGVGDVKQFSEALRMMIDRHYQTSASAGDKQMRSEELGRSFQQVLSFLTSTGPEGSALAQEAKSKFQDRLFFIFQEAHVSPNGLSVLCHGNPIPANMHFLYSDKTQGPTDVKFTGFEHAFYGHASVDLQVFLSTVLGPKVGEQSDFLLRFIYYETFASTLKTFGVDANKVLVFEELQKDFKKLALYGCLIGSMSLAALNGGYQGTQIGMGEGHRGFESKILGWVGKNSPQVYKESAPALRIKTLIQRALDM